MMYQEAINIDVVKKIFVMEKDNFVDATRATGRLLGYYAEQLYLVNERPMGCSTLRKATLRKIFYLNSQARELVGTPFLSQCYNIYSEKEGIQLLKDFSSVMWSIIQNENLMK